ncbi:NTP transferase domain-containing protein, partial [Streptomyces clavuligerus]
MSGGERDTVVLPLAGTGSRLGLPFPKELLPLGDDGGRTVLDAMVDLLAGCADRVRVVAVTGPAGRADTITRLRERCTALGVPLAVVVQEQGLAESTGAVLSAAPWFGPVTLVLLPDQVLHTPDPHAAGQLLDTVRTADSGAGFLAARESDPARLAADGALRIEHHPDTGLRVADYADKPGPGAVDGFNAVWFGYAFTRATAHRFLPVLHAATLRRPMVELGP